MGPIRVLLGGLTPRIKAIKGQEGWLAGDEVNALSSQVAPSPEARCLMGEARNNQPSKLLSRPIPFPPRPHSPRNHTTLFPRLPGPERDIEFPLPVAARSALLRPAPSVPLPPGPRDTRVVRGSSWDS